MGISTIFRFWRGRPKDQIVIAEGIEVAEIGAVGCDLLVIVPPQHLGAAQGVLDRLTQQPGEDQAEGFVAQQVQEAHGLLLHRDRPAARR